MSKPSHDQILAALGVAEHLRRDGLVFPTTPDAIAYARAHLRTSGVLPLAGSAEQPRLTPKPST
ncbi:hypothetical protein ACFQY7_06720 [Actinomadura luteofluorescens]|uniref:hypothetical protein n=1 Tax=Actinomadura luteofluorescens TaxID=46163 RepID=UPI00363B4F1D